MMRLFISTLFSTLWLCSQSVVAMDFKEGGAVAPCRDPDACHMWVEASGEITAESPNKLLEFIAQMDQKPYAIRFNSPGGSLAAGIRIGEILRDHGYESEAAVCASACVHAFLGGVERRLVDNNSLIGVHRFYQEKALTRPTVSQFTGEDLDSVQRIMAGLMLYLEEMGVDMRLLTIASEAGPNEVRWLTPEEAQTLRVTYAPKEWQPWKVTPVATGLIAISETQDGSRSMQISCSGGRGYFIVLDDRESADWFDQCRTVTEIHPVLGTHVKTEDAAVIREMFERRTNGISFTLPASYIAFSDSGIFSDMSVYPMACISTDERYVGTTEGLRQMGTLALRNCVR